MVPGILSRSAASSYIDSCWIAYRCSTYKANGGSNISPTSIPWCADTGVLDGGRHSAAATTPIRSGCESCEKAHRGCGGG